VGDIIREIERIVTHAQNRRKIKVYSLYFLLKKYMLEIQGGCSVVVPRNDVLRGQRNVPHTKNINPKGAPRKNPNLPSNLNRADRGEVTELQGKYLPKKKEQKKKRRRAARAPKVREPNAAKERLGGKAPTKARHKRAPASGVANERPSARKR